MRKNYYRKFASLEQKKNIRKTFVFGVLTVGLLALLFVFGIPAMARIASFVGDFGKSDKPIDIADNIPPAPPRFLGLPEATNKTNIEITGTAEPGAKVTLTVNSDEVEVIADNSGKFIANVDLLNGDNTVKAIAKDNAGNVSQPSEKVGIVYDNTEPKLEIESPEDGSEFTGSSQRQVTIKGKTEAEVLLNINDRSVSVNSDGTFSFTTTLSEGENKFDVKVKDKAENETESTLTLRFSS